MTTERVIEILEDHVCYERKKANEAAVEGDAPWAVAHTYAELGLERIKNEIRKEEEMPHECESCRWYDERKNGPHCGGCTSNSDHWEPADGKTQDTD